MVSQLGSLYAGQKVILATGTFLRSKVIVGEQVCTSGPDGLTSADHLSDSLEELGLKLKRFKTGTPARFHRRSLDFSQMEIQPGDQEVTPFSFENEEDPDWQPGPARL